MAEVIGVIGAVANLIQVNTKHALVKLSMTDDVRNRQHPWHTKHYVNLLNHLRLKGLLHQVVA